jgi:8-oxo-dGTP diphosphatase
VIERDGSILICQRRAGSRHALKWEFPGGKVEPGEEPQAALARELKEELAIDAQIGDEIVRYRYQYPGRSPVLLMFFRVKAYRGEIANLEFADLRWEKRETLTAYDFLEGDIAFVGRLASGEL